MAYVRAFSRQTRRRLMGAEVGDPGFFKFLKRAVTPPKAIRKLQPGKLLASAARIAAPMLPGVGGVIGALIPPPRQQEERPAFTPVYDPVPFTPGPSIADILAARWGIDAFTARNITRAYGLDIGGPPAFDKMTSHPGMSGMGAAMAASKRSMASATPSAKVSTPSFDLGAFLKDAAGAIGGVFKHAPAAMDAASQIALQARKGLGLGQSSGFNLPTGIALPGDVGGLVLGGGGARRKKTRVINLSALNRATARINRFQKVAARVMKSPSYKKAARGAHKRGCKCVACR